MVLDGLAMLLIVVTEEECCARERVLEVCGVFERVLRGT